MGTDPPDEADRTDADETRGADDLRIGVVAYEMEGRRSGVGRYLEGLLWGLQNESPAGWRWTLFFKGDPFPSELFSRDPSSSRSGPRIRAVFDGRPNARPILWEQLRLPRLLRRHDLDFLFSPAYSLPPFSGMPRMLTLHDLSFERLPEEFGPRERWRRRILARLAASRATRVLTDTPFVAREIQETYGVEPERLGVVPLAVDPGFFAATSADPLPAGLAELGIRRPYLLHLGSVLPRRQIHLTLDAFSSLASAEPDVQLVIAGADRLSDSSDLPRRIESSGVAGRIVRVPWVPEELLVPLYAHAAASIYVSKYEGYGLPPLESLASGTPAVVSDGMALDHLWPDYPFRAERNAESILRATRRALHHTPSDFAQEARAVVGRLDWATSARRLVDEIRAALRSAGR